MNNQNELYAYCAGLFDGEGWFRINKIPGHHSRMKNNWAFQCEAAIQMREKNINANHNLTPSKLLLCLPRYGVFIL